MCSACRRWRGCAAIGATLCAAPGRGEQITVLDSWFEFCESGSLRDNGYRAVQSMDARKHIGTCRLSFRQLFKYDFTEGGEFATEAARVEASAWLLCAIARSSRGKSGEPLLIIDLRHSQQSGHEVTLAFAAIASARVRIFHSAQPLPPRSEHARRERRNLAAVEVNAGFQLVSQSAGPSFELGGARRSLARGRTTMAMHRRRKAEARGRCLARSFLNLELGNRQLARASEMRPRRNTDCGSRPAFRSRADGLLRSTTPEPTKMNARQQSR